MKEMRLVLGWSIDDYRSTFLPFSCSWIIIDIGPPVHSSSLSLTLSILRFSSIHLAFFMFVALLASIIFHVHRYLLQFYMAFFIFEILNLNWLKR